MVTCKLLFFRQQLKTESCHYVTVVLMRLLWSMNRAIIFHSVKQMDPMNRFSVTQRQKSAGALIKKD